MNKALRHIILSLSATVLLFSSCGNSEEATVIPRSKLAKIYAEMLVTDQWITATPGVRMVADTSLVYQPILEKYGYDIYDYMKSVDVYMDDPERFSRILRESGKIIGAQLSDAEERLAEYQRLANLPKIEADIDFSEFFPYIFEEPYVHYYDSISFEPDSSLLIYRLKHIERKDTIFDGIRMTVQCDSLSVVDSLETRDSLRVREKADSLDMKPVEMNILESSTLRRIDPAATSGAMKLKIDEDSFK